MKKTILRMAIISFLIFVTATGVFLLAYTVMKHSSWHECLKSFSSLFYIPHHNIFVLGTVKGRPVYLYFYLLIYFFGGVFWLFFRKSLRQEGRRPLMTPLLINTCAALVIILAVQTYAQILDLKEWMDDVGHKTTAEKYESLFGITYQYAQVTKEILPGRHSAKLVTDMDMSQDPGMFNHRQLAYFLYPIDIRGFRGEPEDVLLVFEKENPCEAVPGDYRILTIFNSQNLLAVRSDKFK